MQVWGHWAMLISRRGKASQASNIAAAPTRFSSRFQRGGSMSDHAAEVTQAPDGRGYPDPKSAYEPGKAPSWGGPGWGCPRRQGGSSERFGRPAPPAGGFDQTGTPPRHADVILGNRLPHHFDHTSHFARRR